MASDAIADERSAMVGSLEAVLDHARETLASTGATIEARVALGRPSAAILGDAAEFGEGRVVADAFIIECAKSRSASALLAP